MSAYLIFPAPAGLIMEVVAVARKVLSEAVEFVLIELI